ncbi:hypothetical protein HK405_004830 [Cladochytrium tenue]|nr:hypothetical protein HK405_004830 [Cladochytrium tenue]
MALRNADPAFTVADAVLGLRLSHTPQQRPPFDIFSADSVADALVYPAPAPSSTSPSPTSPPRALRAALDRADADLTALLRSLPVGLVDPASAADAPAPAAALTTIQSALALAARAWADPSAAAAANIITAAARLATLAAAAADRLAVLPPSSALLSDKDNRAAAAVAAPLARRGWWAAARIVAGSASTTEDRFAAATIEVTLALYVRALAAPAQLARLADDAAAVRSHSDPAAVWTSLWAGGPDAAGGARLTAAAAELAALATTTTAATHARSSRHSASAIAVAIAAWAGAAKAAVRRRRWLDAAQRLDAMLTFFAAATAWTATYPATHTWLAAAVCEWRLAAAAAAAAAAVASSAASPPAPPVKLAAAADTGDPAVASALLAVAAASQAAAADDRVRARRAADALLVAQELSPRLALPGLVRVATLAWLSKDSRRAADCAHALAAAQADIDAGEGNAAGDGSQVDGGAGDHVPERALFALAAAAAVDAFAPDLRRSTVTSAPARTHRERAARR